ERYGFRFSKRIPSLHSAKQLCQYQFRTGEVLSPEPSAADLFVGQSNLGLSWALDNDSFIVKVRRKLKGPNDSCI
ncbi:MAG: hypothetical protein ACUVQG_09225, partial [Thermogutta sp.]